jgi:DNA polymerase III alpha subunit
MIEREIDDWGRVIVKADSLVDLLLQGYDMKSLTIVDSPAIEEYNKWCKYYDKPECAFAVEQPPACTPEEEHESRASTWFISDEIQRINVREFLLSMCQEDACRDRVNEEMDLFEERKLEPLLQLMIYLVDHFRERKVVWGVGRGSSVASYVLFLIGVHKINSMAYGLDVHDFLK